MLSLGGVGRVVRECAKKCIKVKQRALGDQMAMSNARRHISSISIELSYWFSLTLNLKNTLSPWHMAYGAREWETIGRTRWSYLILWFIGSPAKICVYFPFHLIYDWKAFASARDFSRTFNVFSAVFWHNLTSVQFKSKERKKSDVVSH